MLKLFEYAVLHHPKVTKDSQGNETQGPDKFITEPKFMMATIYKQVAMLAAREIPDEYLEKLDEVEICVRPFLGMQPSAHVQTASLATDEDDVMRSGWTSYPILVRITSGASTSTSYSAASVSG